MTQDLDRALEEARRQREDDINELANLDDDQLDYLARVEELEDSLTDGIECDADRSV